MPVQSSLDTTADADAAAVAASPPSARSWGLLELFAALVTLKALIQLLAFGIAVATHSLPREPPWPTVLLALTYGSMGLLLIGGGRRDIRCRELGLFLLLIGSAFADALGRLGSPLGGASAVLAACRLEAFLPACWWSFVRDFPFRAPLGWSFVWPARAVRVTMAIGVGLAAINAIAPLYAATFADIGWLRVLLYGGTGLYWPLLFILMVAAVPVLVARARRVGPRDRRRVMFFVSSVVAGLVPIAIDVVLRATSPGWNRWLAVPGVRLSVVSIVYAALLSVPVTTAYSVLVARVVDLHFLIRAALSYALARYTVIGTMTVPFAALAAFVYSNRTLAVQEVLSRPYALLLISVGVASAAALGARGRLLTAIDRRFFREQYDAQLILNRLVDLARRADSSGHLADLLVTEIDRALHVTHIAVLLRSEVHGGFVGRRERTGTVPADSMLVRLLSSSDDPLDLEPEDPRSLVHRLGAADAAWVTEGNVRLLVPLRGVNATLIGIIAIGDKRSELPYSPADRRLLAAVGASGGLYLETHRTRETPRGVPAGGWDLADAPEDSAAGVECVACHLVHDTGTAACACGGSVMAAAVPKRIAGKFRTIRRIGAGGMGVVYLAEDIALGRKVAVKTLPTTSAEHTWRLRREARAMAFVTHPHLALIYGVESWRRTPLLIEEYLVGGTLSDRLKRGPMTVDDMLSLGSPLFEAVGALHDAGLLHGDIKPSNLGFAADGTLKLLDFGLARLLRQEAAPPGPDTTTTSHEGWAESGHHLVGTPAYMAPEAFRKETPRPSFDLWSAAVVLLEAITGRNPFKGETLFDTFRHVEAGLPAEVSDRLAGFPEPVGAFFAGTLAVDRKRRPSSAAECGRRLHALR